MSASPMILIPRPVPAGEQVQTGKQYEFPTCDRCRRESSERNPVMLSARKTWDQRELARADRFKRRDAICYECRLAMKGR